MKISARGAFLKSTGRCQGYSRTEMRLSSNWTSSACHVGLWSETDWEALPDERRDQRRDDEELAIATGNAPLEVGRVIDPNTAACHELMRLPGIGEKLASRIIENRPYSDPSDLRKVSGIGPAILEKILA